VAKKAAKANAKNTSWKAKRASLADSIAFGTAGWFQTKACSGLANVINEDAAKFVIAELINSSHRFRADISRKPANWPKHSKKRLDIRLSGLSTGSTGAYGFVEVKWPKSAIAGWDVARLQIIQDAVRVLSAQTANLNAAFVVVGCDTEAIDKLFNRPHNDPAIELTRTRFHALFPQHVDHVGHITLAHLISNYSPSR
jgi:hypothetical protein